MTACAPLCCPLVPRRARPDLVVRFGRGEKLPQWLRRRVQAALV